jgi:hypothetical protein
MAIQLRPDVRERLKICQTCPHWSGRCNKNFNLGSMMGCPDKKFPPVGHAGYAPDYVSTVGATSSGGCCGERLPVLKMDAKLTAGQVTEMFATSMVNWGKKGFKLVDEATHTKRYAQCQVCPLYKNYLCQRCACLAFLKTKLAGQRCPDNPPRWI